MTFNKFYQKTREERINTLKELDIINNEDENKLLNNETLNIDIAGKMAENHLGTFALPFSIVPEIIINNENYSVPMVTEEPSVVAACSNASKIVNKSGGFRATILDRKMIGQVALYNVPNLENALIKITDNKDTLLSLANEAHPSIVKRGGGALEIETKTYSDEKNTFLVVYLTVDVKEAMGANIINTMLETLKPKLEELTEGQALMAILSNYATKSLVKAKCSINVDHLHANIDTARKIAEKIELASSFAKLDPYRAATHNKGIFNGIDAIVIASGNDWRAIEASGHSYASKNGRYEGLTTWQYDKTNEVLHGELTLPMPIATVGGSIGLNETVNITNNILKNPDAKTLSSIIVSIGLAQNLAALRALVSVGIQQGHMKLHAKSLALLAGATNEESEKLASLLAKEKNKNLETAKRILTELRENK